MTLADFAKQCGVTIVDCGPNWGGRIGYKEKDYPNSTTCGFRTEGAAYKRWMSDTFGPSTSKTILKLLKETK